MTLICIVCAAGYSEDLAERAYHVPVLKPKHKDKPKVKGWAKNQIEERIDRGMIATATNDEKVYLGWRLLQSDSETVAFNVYRSIEGGSAVKLNEKPIAKTTDFVDERPILKGEVLYLLKAVVEGKELEACGKVRFKAGKEKQLHYSSIKFEGDYMPHRIGIGDLNGDGVYDFVIKQPSMSIDPAYEADRTGRTYKLEGYLADGTFLWRKDLGLGIEPGIWYSPYVVYDFDGDGRAEVAVKTGTENVRESDGRVRKGPEWCSILDGMTGEEITRADWPPRDGRLGDYNRTNRNQMGVAYLDGKTPCLLVARGTYKLMMVDAYQYHNKKLEKLWHWEGDDETPIIRSQGAHGMHSADVDGDGCDEVILGSVVLDDNGTALWSTGYGHPDKCFVTDVDPSRPGLEIFYAIEPSRDDGNGVCLVDADTGETIWNIGRRTYHVGDGMVADIDPLLPGLECFATEDPKGGSRDRYMFSAGGKEIGTKSYVPGCRDWIFWDGDLLRETVNYNRRSRHLLLNIVKYKYARLTFGIEGRVIMIADIVGDWREELITTIAGELRIYTTTILAEDRRVCLMQDAVYRAEVAHRSMGYEQSPVTGYYLGVSAEDVIEKSVEFDRQNGED